MIKFLDVLKRTRLGLGLRNVTLDATIVRDGLQPRIPEIFSTVTHIDQIADLNLWDCVCTFHAIEGDGFDAFPDSPICQVVFLSMKSKPRVMKAAFIAAKAGSYNDAPGLCIQGHLELLEGGMIFSMSCLASLLNLLSLSTGDRWMLKVLSFPPTVEPQAIQETFNTCF
jgi:hypothetical protein